MELTKQKLIEFKRKLSKEKLNFINKNGFYGCLVMGMPCEISTKINTACTDGKRIIFNPDFLDGLKSNEIQLVLHHEVMHCSLYHLTRRKQREPKLWNIACDIVINSHIKHENNDEDKAITIHIDGKPQVLMHTIANKEGYHYSAEQVYEMILNGRKFCNGGLSIDDHSIWQQCNEEADDLEQYWKMKNLEAAKMIKEFQSSKAGSIPGNIQKELRIAEGYESELNWEDVLSDFIEIQSQSTEAMSYIPPDHRFPARKNCVIHPNMNEMQVLDQAYRTMVFLIDVSGSISDRIANAFVSEVRQCLEKFPTINGYIAFHDVHIVGKPMNLKDFQKENKIKLFGGGGTSFEIPLKYMQEKMEPKPQAIVWLTDGYANFPNESLVDVDICWIITNEEVSPPYGKVTRLIEKE